MNTIPDFLWKRFNPFNDVMNSIVQPLFKRGFDFFAFIIFCIEKTMEEIDNINSEVLNTGYNLSGKIFNEVNDVGNRIINPLFKRCLNFFAFIIFCIEKIMEKRSDINCKILNRCCNFARKFF